MNEFSKVCGKCGKTHTKLSQYSEIIGITEDEDIGQVIWVNCGSGCGSTGIIIRPPTETI